METEFKFSLSDPSVFDQIAQNAKINKIGLEAVEVIDMEIFVTGVLLTGSARRMTAAQRPSNGT